MMSAWLPKVVYYLKIVYILFMNSRLVRIAYKDAIGLFCTSSWRGAVTRRSMQLQNNVDTSTEFISRIKMWQWMYM